MHCDAGVGVQGVAGGQLEACCGLENKQINYKNGQTVCTSSAGGLGRGGATDVRGGVVLVSLSYSGSCYPCSNKQG